MGQWVLGQAWADREHLQRQRAEEITVSVNVSAHQFMAAGFANMVASALDVPSADPRLLTLEVTETVFVRDVERALTVLDELKAIGVKLALDDFGTGYSSLSYLRSLPIDTIKIDQSFISELGGDPTDYTILAAIIQLAHGLGLTVVCEGVETSEQRRHLVKLGSDSCQGFYFAHPMPAFSLDALLHQDGDGSSRCLPMPAAAISGHGAEQWSG
jgi:EAL domain-containing protein (putative c-di-GMP-specific phosphodiesterase class I)